MPKIRINKNGWVTGPNIPSSEEDTEMEVSSEIFGKLGQIPFTKNWRYVNGEFVLEDLMDDNTLRSRRQKECFNIIDNRSQLWYNHLTDAQKQELDGWYEAWLSVTETHVIPVKPDWL